MNSLLHASYGPSSANTNTFWLKGSAVTKNAPPVTRQVMVTADAFTGAPLREINLIQYANNDLTSKNKSYQAPGKNGIQAGEVLEIKQYDSSTSPAELRGHQFIATYGSLCSKISAVEFQTKLDEIKSQKNYDQLNTLMQDASFNPDGYHKMCLEPSRGDPSVENTVYSQLTPNGFVSFMKEAASLEHPYTWGYVAHGNTNRPGPV